MEEPTSVQTEQQPQFNASQVKFKQIVPNQTFTQRMRSQSQYDEKLVPKTIRQEMGHMKTMERFKERTGGVLSKIRLPTISNQKDDQQKSKIDNLYKKKNQQKSPLDSTSKSLTQELCEQFYVSSNETNEDKILYNLRIKIDINNIDMQVGTFYEKMLNQSKLKKNTTAFETDFDFMKQLDQNIAKSNLDQILYNLDDQRIKSKHSKFHQDQTVREKKMVLSIIQPSKKLNRQDVNYLKDWFINQISTIDTQGSTKERFQDELNLISSCFNQIIYQVSIDCYEMGQFIRDVWNHFLNFIEYNIYLKSKIQEKNEERNIQHIKMLDDQIELNIKMNQKSESILQVQKEQLQEQKQRVVNALIQEKRLTQRLKTDNYQTAFILSFLRDKYYYMTKSTEKALNLTYQTCRDTNIYKLIDDIQYYYNSILEPVTFDYYVPINYDSILQDLDAGQTRLIRFHERSTQTKHKRVDQQAGSSSDDPDEDENKEKQENQQNQQDIKANLKQLENQMSKLDWLEDNFENYVHEQEEEEKRIQQELESDSQNSQQTKWENEKIDLMNKINKLQENLNHKQKTIDRISKIDMSDHIQSLLELKDMTTLPNQIDYRKNPELREEIQAKFDRIVDKAIFMIQIIPGQPSIKEIKEQRQKRIEESMNQNNQELSQEKHSKPDIKKSKKKGAEKKRASKKESSNSQSKEKHQNKNYNFSNINEENYQNKSQISEEDDFEDSSLQPIKVINQRRNTEKQKSIKTKKVPPARQSFNPRSVNQVIKQPELHQVYRKSQSYNKINLQLNHPILKEDKLNENTNDQANKKQRPDTPTFLIQPGSGQSSPKGPQLGYLKRLTTQIQAKMAVKQETLESMVKKIISNMDQKLMFCQMFYMNLEKQFGLKQVVERKWTQCLQTFKCMKNGLLRFFYVILEQELGFYGQWIRKLVGTLFNLKKTQFFNFLISSYAESDTFKGLERAYEFIEQVIEQWKGIRNILNQKNFKLIFLRLLKAQFIQNKMRKITIFKVLSLFSHKFLLCI